MAKQRIGVREFLEVVKKALCESSEKPSADGGCKRCHLYLRGLVSNVATFGVEADSGEILAALINLGGGLKIQTQDTQGQPVILEVLAELSAHEEPRIGVFSESQLPVRCGN